MVDTEVMPVSEGQEDIDEGLVDGCASDRLDKVIVEVDHDELVVDHSTMAEEEV